MITDITQLKCSLLLILALSFCSACSGLSGSPDDVDVVQGNDLLTCSISDAPSGPDAGTKTSLSRNYFPVWTAGDCISVITAEGNCSKFTIVDGAGTTKGTFRGALEESTTYYALYPYDAGNTVSGSRISFTKPQEITGAVDDIPQNSNVMVASFTDSNLNPAFKNVFGLLEIKLSGTSKVGKISLTGNSSQMLWGDFSMSIDNKMGTDSQQLTVANGSNETSLVFSPAVQLSEVGTHSFYFTLPSGSLNNGFTIDVYDGAGNLVSTQTSVRNQSISRSRIRSMSTITDVNRIPELDLQPEPFTWSAYSNLGRSGTADQTVIDPQTSGYPRTKGDKYVGTFYFIWHTSNSAGGGPYDIQKFLGAGNYNFLDVSDYACGGGKTHHWGEPYLGYYRDDDLWVLRKHAQMLADAGVDFIAFDVTNNVWYESEITKLCELYLEMRAEGYKTPQLTFMVWHSGANGQSASELPQINHNSAVTYLYNYFYTNPRYADLWFKWEGKPLMLARGKDVTSAKVREYFTFRSCWYLWNTHAQTQSDVGDPWWYEDGTNNDKWPWAVCYTNDTTDPMIAGKHNGVNEFCPVSPATHPVSNIGRSYPINQGIRYNSGLNSYVKQPSKGIYFKSQFNAAMQLDPKILFFTGWNEFLMGHFNPGVLEFYWCGGVKAKNSMFVDQYNNEFSRDIEPVNGDFGDNYYYYMADFIRQFKGVDELPGYSKRHTIDIDGKFADWINVASAYADDKYDTKWRGYDSNGGNNGWPAYGNTLPRYVNKTGRNDIYISKVATDGKSLFFYVESVDNLRDYADNLNGLKLLITSGNTAGAWEGFNYMLNPVSDSKATLLAAQGGSYAWTTVSSDIDIRVGGKAMEVSIPLSSIGIASADSFSIDFKWVDNVDLSLPDGIQQCMRDGDSAPNGRFRYRYIFGGK